MTRSIIIVGAGIFGVTTALEMRRRGWSVSLFDPGPIPRPTAASTDISKVVRLDYGGDELYTALAEAALEGWDALNSTWSRPLYHQDGFLLLTREAMQPGGFEYEGQTLLQKRGHTIRRVNSAILTNDFPAWRAAKYPDDYLNPRGGWAESGNVVAQLAAEARTAGVAVHENTEFARLMETGSRVTGVVTGDGHEHRGDIVLMATGAWTPKLLPQLSKVMWATGQSVLHFKAPNQRDYTAPRFPVWAADISRTGWYGFPALADGTLKVANHGRGRRVDPEEPRVVEPAEEGRFREFLGDSLPAVADAPVIGSRLCLYCDTFDGNFWIDHDPARPGLVVAAGDSGHAFKFAPALGGLIADVVERKPNQFAARFAWRERTATAREGARA